MRASRWNKVSQDPKRSASDSSSFAPLETSSGNAAKATLSEKQKKRLAKLAKLKKWKEKQRKFKEETSATVVSHRKKHQRSKIVKPSNEMFVEKTVGAKKRKLHICTLKIVFGK